MLQPVARETAKPVHEIVKYQHDRVVQRYAIDHGVSIGVAEKRFVGLLEFLAICAIMPGAKVTSAEIDTMWHTFLLFTRDYKEFCECYLGRFINHEPFERPNPSAYLSTRAFAERVLGPLDLELWPLEAKGDCSSGCGE